MMMIGKQSCSDSVSVLCCFETKMRRRSWKEVLGEKKYLQLSTTGALNSRFVRLKRVCNVFLVGALKLPRVRNWCVGF